MRHHPNTRTAAPTRRGVAVAAAATVALLVTGCGADTGTTSGTAAGTAAETVPGQGSSRIPKPSPEVTVGKPEAPSSAAAAEGSTAPAAAAPVEPVEQPVRLFAVGGPADNARLYATTRRLPVPTGNPVEPAVIAATGSEPTDPDYRSPWRTAGVIVTGVRVAPVAASGVTPVVVTVTAAAARRPVGVSESDAAAALQQVAYTARAAAGGPVSVSFADPAGTPLPTVLGIPANRVRPGHPDRVLAPVWVTGPAEGATVTSPVTVTGIANAFEATVVWELRRGDTVVKDGFATAREAYTRAPYRFTVQAPPGIYTLVVSDTDPSEGEGNPPWRDTKTITVTD